MSVDQKLADAIASHALAADGTTRTTMNDVPFREDPCAEVRRERDVLVGEKSTLLMRVDNLQKELEALRLKTRLRRLGERVVIWAMTGLGVGVGAALLTLASAGIRECARPTPQPSAGERTAAANYAAERYLAGLYPGERAVVACGGQHPTVPLGSGTRTVYELECLATVSGHVYRLVCSDQIGGANDGCHDLNPTGLRSTP